MNYYERWWSAGLLLEAFLLQVGKVFEQYKKAKKTNISGKKQKRNYVHGRS